MKAGNTTYQQYRLPVPPEFAEVFIHFYFAKNHTEIAQHKTLLPTFQTILIFHFGAKVLLGDKKGRQQDVAPCSLLGPIKTACDYTLHPGAEMLVVNFKDDAFYRFFGKAFFADQLAADPDDILGDNCFIGLWQQLKQIERVDDKVKRLLNFCRPYLKPAVETATLLADYKNDLRFSPIKKVAEEVGQSERNIQLAYKKHFGYTAKENSRYQRFIAAVVYIQEILLAEKELNWFEVIARYGYYDQSHLIRDFQHFVGITPNAFVKFQERMCR